MKTNQQVADAFVAGKDYADSASMHVRGFDLYSYATIVARRVYDGTIAVTTDRYSATTSTQHMPKIRYALASAGYQPTDRTIILDPGGRGNGPTHFVVWEKGA